MGGLLDGEIPAVRSISSESADRLCRFRVGNADPVELTDGSWPKTGLCGRAGQSTNTAAGMTKRSTAFRRASGPLPLSSVITRPEFRS